MGHGSGKGARIGSGRWSGLREQSGVRKESRGGGPVMVRVVVTVVGKGGGGKSSGSDNEGGSSRALIPRWGT